MTFYIIRTAFNLTKMQMAVVDDSVALNPWPIHPHCSGQGGAGPIQNHKIRVSLGLWVGSMWRCAFARLPRRGDQTVEGRISLPQWDYGIIIPIPIPDTMSHNDELFVKRMCQWPWLGSLVD